MASPPQYELSSLPERETRSTSPVSSIYSMGNSRRGSNGDQFVTNTFPAEPSIPGSTIGLQISERTLDGFDNNSTSSLHDEDLPAYSSSPATSKVTSYTLERNWGGLVVSLVFSTLVLLQWIGLVYICYRPFGSRHSYEVTAATTEYDFKLNERWLKVFQSLSTICSLFLVIVVSTVLSRAAVLLTQRRNAKPGYTLSQIFAIADESWLSIPVIWKLLTNKNMRSIKSGYLFYAFSLCIAVILIYPIQQGFLQIHDIHVPNPEYPTTSYFNFLAGTYYYPFQNGETVLYDLYKSRGFQGALNADLIGTDPDGAQPNLWNPSNSSRSYLNGRVSANISQGLQQRLSNPLTSWYAIQNNTYNNGMYNSTGLRMNTSISCNSIEKNEYPEICEGSAPWSTLINLTSVNDTMYSLYAMQHFNALSLRVCVPGNRFAFPWSVNTTLQTIEEELYFDISGSFFNFDTNRPYLQNYTQRCTANTTSGYFNLPTYSNTSAGPLLPADTFVYGAISLGATTPRETYNTSNRPNDQYYAIDGTMLNYHGPLLSSALALFPDWSNLVDEAGGIDERLGVQWPLSKFTGSTVWNESYASYLSRYSANPNYLENSLRISTFLATKTAWEVAASNINTPSHPLFTEMGKRVKRPHLPISIVVIISILVGYATLSILYLGFRSAKRTWTTTLNTLSMTLLTRDAAERMPRIPVVLHSNSGNELRLMRSLAGESAVIGDLMAGDKVGMLAVGAEGIIGMGGRRYRDAIVVGPLRG
ncbi:hypothetical protein NHQ30_009623 [Ciborinia camelliae]|nr:hypothetical protein NHQ30_009623 [Ciborinia camelliae]